MMHQNFNDPQIILKTYDLFKEFYQEIRKWPKPEKYNLGKECEKLILEIFCLLISASRHYQTYHCLKQANFKLQIIKYLFRLARDLNILTNRKYIFFEKNILEIGRMLGGWLNSLSQPPSK